MKCTNCGEDVHPHGAVIGKDRRIAVPEAATETDAMAQHIAMCHSRLGNLQGRYLLEDSLKAAGKR